MKAAIRLQSFLFIVATSCAPPVSQNVPKRVGIKNVQVPMSELKPLATFSLGGKPDWTVITGDAVWISNSELHAVQRIDPRTNQVIAKVDLPGKPCSGLVYGFGSVWSPICGNGKGLARIDPVANRVTAILPLFAADDEGSIAASEGSVWLVANNEGLLLRVDPKTDQVKQEIHVPAGSYNPMYSDGIVWVTGIEKGVLTPVNADTGEVMAPIAVGSRPRFLTAGAGLIWTLNQGDGSVTRVDAKTRRVTARIEVGIPGPGGEICYSDGSVWTTVIGIPLTKIDVKGNKVEKQWVGLGGDSVRYGHGTLWLTDLEHGQVWRLKGP